MAIRLGGDDRGSSPITVSSGDIGRRVLSEDVYYRLLRMIASGSLRPETKWIETHLAKELSVSQAPVREALRKLEAAGIAEIQHYRGSIVRDPSPMELIDALAVRGRLEALAGELATQAMTEEVLDQLESLAAKMAEASSAETTAEYIRRNTAFHGLIVETTENDALMRIWLQLEPFTRTFVTATLGEVHPASLRRNHSEVIALIREGDPREVASALESHVLEARQALMDALGGKPERAQRDPSQ